jgi:hypothetical protein
VAPGGDGRCEPLGWPAAKPALKGPQPFRPQPTNAAGIWEGTAVTGNVTLDTLGIVTESGEGRFVDENGTQYVIDTFSGNDGNVSLSFTAVAQVGFTFLDGSTVATGKMTGSVEEHGSFTGEYDLSTGESGTISMTYNPMYERDSSLDKLTGLWDEEFGVASFDPSGSFFMQDSFGCVFEGQASIVDAQFNAYSLSMTVSSCGAGVDGQYTGLGVLSDLNSTEDLFIVQMNSDEWIFTTSLVRQ